MMDIHQILWAFPGKLHLVQIGGKFFIAKRRFDATINMDGVRAILDTLSLRSDNQRIQEYALAKEDELRRREGLLDKNKPRRIKQQQVYRELIISQRENSTMTSEERGYRIHLARSLKTANGELKLHLQRELDQLNRIGWKERSACKICGNEIPLEKMIRHLRTNICEECNRNGQLPCGRTLAVSMSL